MQFTPERRLGFKANYENLIAVQEGKKEVIIKGKIAPIPPLAFMLPHWRKGLEFLTELMVELKEL